MEESADEVNKREELLKMYHSTKEALKIISKSNVIKERSLNIIDKRYNNNYEVYCEPIKTQYFRSYCVNVTQGMPVLASRLQLTQLVVLMVCEPYQPTLSYDCIMLSWVSVSSRLYDLGRPQLELSKHSIVTAIQSGLQQIAPTHLTLDTCLKDL